MDNTAEEKGDKTDESKVEASARCGPISTLGRSGTGRTQAGLAGPRQERKPAARLPPPLTCARGRGNVAVGFKTSLPRGPLPQNGIGQPGRQVREGSDVLSPPMIRIMEDLSGDWRRLMSVSTRPMRRPNAAHLGSTSRDPGHLQDDHLPRTTRLNYKRQRTEKSQGFGLLRLLPQACLVIVRLRHGDNTIHVLPNRV